MALHYKIIPVTAFQQNCTLLWCSQTNQAAIVDPGGDLARITATLRQNSLTACKILITHGHIDHAGAAAELAAQLNIPIEGPQREDQFWIDSLPQAAEQYGFPKAEAFQPSRWLEDGDTITLGKEVLQVRHCPGHTPGHVIYFHADSRLALVGDVLFKDSIGRTDFPRGNFATLINSIRQRLWPLGDDVRFISGHGPMSNFGTERLSNPFCADE